MRADTIGGTVKRTRFVPIATAVLAAALLAGCSSTGGTAATVDGVRYSQHDLEAELRAQRDNEKYWNASQQGAAAASSRESVPAQLTADWLTRHIYTEIVAATPLARRAKPSDAERTDVEAQLSQTPGWQQFPAWFRTELVDSNATAIATQKAYTGASLQPTDAELEAFFTKYRAQICASGKVVSHILVKTQAEAAAIAAQLKGGADFATIAKAQSTDTGSAAEGGSLGCLGAQPFVTEFQNAADALPVGGTSAPVETQYGWHIIRVEAATYAALRTDVQNAYQQVNDAKFQRWVQRQVAKADVSVNPQYGTWRKSQGAYKVVAPKAPAPQVRPTPQRTGATGTTGSRGTGTTTP